MPRSTTAQQKSLLACWRAARAPHAIRRVMRLNWPAELPARAHTSSALHSVACSAAAAVSLGLAAALGLRAGLGFAAACFGLGAALGLAAACRALRSRSGRYAWPMRCARQRMHDVSRQRRWGHMPPVPSALAATRISCNQCAAEEHASIMPCLVPAWRPACASTVAWHTAERRHVTSFRSCSQHATQIRTESGEENNSFRCSRPAHSPACRCRAAGEPRPCPSPSPAQQRLRRRQRRLRPAAPRP